MKSTLKTKLKLKKQNLANLNLDQMSVIRGGDSEYCITQFTWTYCYCGPPTWTDPIALSGCNRPCQ